MDPMQYYADKMFGPCPPLRVGFKEKWEGFWKDNGQWIAVSLVWLMFLLHSNMEARQEGRNEALREVSRIAEDHALLSKYLFDHGH